MRIQKYIAEAGICSRRKAEELIEKGLVKVNGETLSEFGYQVQENDRVEVDGQEICGFEKKVYYMMNKPVGYVTTVKDQFDRPCVMDFIGEDIKERIYPAGRLDYHTEGLLILSNDGEFVNTITHPKNEIEKKYIAVVNGIVKEENIEKLKRGVMVDKKKTAPAKVFLSEIFKDKCVVEITIREGRNRQVRKMFEAVGHHVIELKRVQIGPLELGNLKLGRIRKLNPNEVQALMSAAGK
ncbi:MAG: rRNA pseudouridine synthase [Clostridia bacterium]|nr:rRNA pseudouridine synthase [Clostridia bacterium]